jgi:hypothetical protein
MPSKVYSAAVIGVEAFEVEIEVHAGWGNTDKIGMVGLPDTAVKEAKIESPPPFATVGCAGHMDSGSLSIWHRPMSARKGPALICRSPWLRQRHGRSRPAVHPHGPGPRRGGILHGACGYDAGRRARQSGTQKGVSQKFLTAQACD